MISRKIIKKYLGTAPLFELVDKKNSVNLIFLMVALVGGVI